MSSKNQSNNPARPRSNFLYFPSLLFGMFKGGGHGGMEGAPVFRGLAGISTGNPEYYPKDKTRKAGYRDAQRKKRNTYKKFHHRNHKPKQFR